MELRDTAVEIRDRIPEAIRDLENPFSKELIGLWDRRYIQGLIFILRDQGQYQGYILLEQGKKYTIRGVFIWDNVRYEEFEQKLLEEVCRFLDIKKQNCLANITKGAEKIYLDHGFEILGPRTGFLDQVKAIRRYKS